MAQDHENRKLNYVKTRSRECGWQFIEAAAVTTPRSGVMIGLAMWSAIDIAFFDRLCTYEPLRGAPMSFFDIDILRNQADLHEMVAGATFPSHTPILIIAKDGVALRQYEGDKVIYLTPGGIQRLIQ
jgi:hypothetical protein